MVDVGLNCVERFAAILSLEFVKAFSNDGIVVKEPPPGTEERVAKMTFASVYPHLVKKVEKKGRTLKELHQVIEWLTGYDEATLQSLLESEVDFETFFKRCRLNPKAKLITGVVCGYRVEEIKSPLLRQVRCLDKLVDELAKGKKMEKILRVVQS